MDRDDITEISKPYISRLTAQIDAMADTCNMMKEAIDDMDWNLAFRATTILTLIEQLLGITIGTTTLLDFFDEQAKRQLRGDIDD